MNPKKAGAFPSSSSLLSTAIKDLDTQLKALKRDRTNLQSDLNKVSNAIEVDHTLEKELQEKIASLMEKEAKLTERKKRIAGDLDKVSDRIGKVSKIRSEMSDL